MKPYGNADSFGPVKVTANDDLWAATLDAADPTSEPSDTLSNYPSSLFKLFSCPRRYYWDRVDPLSENRDWRLTASHGNSIHEMLVDIIKRSGRWRGDEVRGSSKRANLSYRIDCLFWDDHNIVPVEIKSANHNSYERFTKKPNRSHILQLMSYLHFHQPTPYEYGYLLYYDKDKDVATFRRIDYSPEMGAEIEARLVEMEENFAFLELPTGCDEEAECRRCPYEQRCDEEYAKSQ